jgi:hypothetical protein
MTCPAHRALPCPLRSGSGRQCPPAAWVAALLLAISFALGCKSADQPVSSGIAWHDFHGNTPGQVCAVAKKVFVEHGYQLADQAYGRLVLEKEASKWINISYGNWIGDEPVWVRVKLSTFTSGPETIRLGCQVYFVRDRGRSTEEEVAATRFQKGQYEKLIEETAHRLSGAPAAAP